MKIASIVGARPQFIKAAMVSRALSSRPGVRELLIHTGQHYDAAMSDVFFRELDGLRRPDVNLGIGGGTHGQNTGRMLEALEASLRRARPDWVVVYGDTDSTLAGALAASKLGLRVAHVEAGLRSFNRRMPEELNRVLTDHASDLLFAPTEGAVLNLEREGIPARHVRRVGDVMYDAALCFRDRARRPTGRGVPAGGFVLCTIHRAENTDDRTSLRRVLRSVNSVARATKVVLPLHPRTRRAMRVLGENGLHRNVFVTAPVGYLEMTWLLSRCDLVLTDSGGVQKEAYFHGKPCVTLRGETEWVELVHAGVNRLAPPGVQDAYRAYRTMRVRNVVEHQGIYGRGDAAELIVETLLRSGARAGTR